jgi:hypothetical protein
VPQNVPEDFLNDLQVAVIAHADCRSGNSPNIVKLEHPLHAGSVGRKSKREMLLMEFNNQPETIVDQAG